MTVDTGSLNRSTLQRQLLLERASRPVPEAVRSLVALQAQEPASPYLALWNRLDGVQPADLDAPLHDGTLVRATLLRITLHLAHRADWASFHTAVLPVLRGPRLGDRRFTRTGCTVEQVDRFVPEVVAFAARPRSEEELRAFVAARFGAEAATGVWWALRTFAPLRRATSGGSWSFEGPAVHCADQPTLSTTRDDAMRALARRYLAAFGPATARDLAQFTLVDRRTAREALAPDDEIELLGGDDGAALVDLRGAGRPPADVPAPPRLLGMWDSVLLAYHDRSRVLPDAYRSVVLRRNGNVLPTLLVDGLVAGTWRTTDDGVEVTAFRPLEDQVWDQVEHEATSVLSFLRGRDPRPYRRYDHWWSKPMPRAQVRTLAG